MAVTGTDLIIVERSGTLYRTTAADVAALGGGGSSDPLDLTVDTVSAPPADTVRLFRRKIAERQMPAFIGPSGLDSALQPFIGRNKVGIWMPPGNATTVPGVFGMPAMTVTGFTITARSFAVTNLFTRKRRNGHVTAATAGTVGHFRGGTGQYSMGNGTLGGFFMVATFGISDAAPVATARMFFGARANNTPTNVSPATLTNCIGVGHDAGDTTLKIYWGGTVAQTPVDLGANFPANTANVDFYELSLFAPASSTVCHWMVRRLNTGDVAEGTISGTVGTQVPSTTQLIALPWAYRTNNATALAVGLDVSSVYTETDD